jgi:radical SAM protein with 4Fe4S-binding SPASM domain
MMSPQHFKRVIREVKPVAKAVTLHVMGEPLAHPSFPEFLRILEEENVPLILTSNGLLLDRHRELLLNAPTIKQVNFSVHSFFDNFPDKEIRPYLEKLSQFAKDFVSRSPESFVNFRLWDLPAKDQLLQERHDRIYDELRTLFIEPELPAHIEVREKKSYRLDRHIKLHFDTQFEWPSLNSVSSVSDGFCYGLKNQLAILTEGTVVPCCLDKEAVINLGSAFETHLSEILNSPRAKSILEGFSKNKAIEPLCQKCQYKNRFR